MTQEEILDHIIIICKKNHAQEVILFGSRAKFSITLDLVWKTMKDIILQYYMVSGFAVRSL